MASFRKRGDKWEYRIKYKDPATGKQREKSKGGFKTKKEAQIEAAEIEKKLYYGQHTVIKNQDILIKDWLTEWLHDYGSHCQTNTLKTRKFFIHSLLIPHLGYFKLSQLTRKDYQDFINKLIKQYSKSTVQTIHSVFCSAINKAVELEMLTHNKFTHISIKKKDEISDIKNNYLNKDQVTEFLKVAKMRLFHHYIIVSMLLRTGMRKGELLALTWDDIDFEKKAIQISKSRGQYGVKPPKTKSSIRTITIDDTLIEELKTYKSWQKKNRLKYGPNYQESEYLITSPNGSEIGEFAVNKIIDHIVKKANLHHITPHGLRHTHAIMLLESGADIKYVSERLGHTTINMTANVYLHVTEKQEKENVKKLEAYLNQ